MYKQIDEPIINNIIAKSKNEALSESDVLLLTDVIEEHYQPMEREIKSMVRECCAGSLKKEIKSLIEEGRDTREYNQTMYVNKTTDKVLRRMYSTITGKAVPDEETYTIVGMSVKTEYKGKAIEGWPVMETTHKNGDHLK